MTYVYIWLLILAATIIIEFMTMGLTTIWFAGGALIAALFAGIGGPLWLQITVFIIVSFGLLLFTRPIAVKYFNRERQRTNVESMIGRQGVVISEIDNLKSIGQVSVGGQEWSARSYEDRRVIPTGTIVTVMSISGVKLIVKIDDSVADYVPEIRSDAELDPRVIEEEE